MTSLKQEPGSDSSSDGHDSTASSVSRILFTGYAQVHFLCFLPVYMRLVDDPEVEIWFSGGFRHKDGKDVRYQIQGFYSHWDLETERIIPFDAAKEGEYDVVVCAHTSDKMFPRSVGRKVQIFHGVSFKNFAVREKTLKYDFLCLPGRYHAERYRAMGLVRAGGPKCLITGFPKADGIVSGEHDQEGFLRRAGIDPGRPTILFAPTGGKKNALETMGREVISAIRSDGRWNLLIKPHDHPKKKIDWFAELADLEDQRVRMVRSPDINPWLRSADLLITDASSVAVEYTLLDRPIIFIDVPELLENVIKRGAPLDLDTYGRKIGTVISDPAEIVPAVERGLVSSEAEGPLRRRMASHVFFEPGKAADRVTAVIRHAAGLSRSLPPDIEVMAT